MNRWVKVMLMAMGPALICSEGLAQQFTSPRQYNSFEDAAVAMAQEWQSGKKAKPMISSDGKVIFPFGQSMPRLTCSPTRACDVEMEPAEKIKKVTLGDEANWTWDGAESMSKGKVVLHIAFQPRDIDVETNAIIYTDRRTYHIKLFSPKKEGAYLNRVGFYYPEQLVHSWEEKMGHSDEEKQKEESSNVLVKAVPVEQLDYNYRIEGDADWKPVRVVNDGERVYLEMPDSVRTGTNPSLHLLNDKDEVQIVTYRRKENEVTGRVHFEVDRLFKKAELVVDKEKVRITWTKKEKGVWNSLFGSRD